MGNDEKDFSRVKQTRKLSMDWREIEFEFAMPDPEYRNLFTLHHGLGLDELNLNIQADLTNNLLTIEIERDIFARACIEALKDEQLVLSISGMQFELKYNTLSISIIEDMKLRIAIDIIAWPPLATRISNVL
jgi:hypothetical protein